MLFLWGCSYSDISPPGRPLITFLKPGSSKDSDNLRISSLCSEINPSRVSILWKLIYLLIQCHQILTLKRQGDLSKLWGNMVRWKSRHGFCVVRGQRDRLRKGQFNSTETYGKIITPGKDLTSDKYMCLNMIFKMIWNKTIGFIVHFQHVLGFTGPLAN